MRFDETLAPGIGYFIDGEPPFVDERSPYQRIEIFRSVAFGLALRLDDRMQTSEGDEFFYHEPLVHAAVLAARRPRRVLIVGGGDGGAAEEALKWPEVERVDMVEIDARVVELSRQHLRAIHRGVLDGDDARLVVHIADARAWLEAQGAAARYDVIALDLTDRGGPSERLYGRDFYALCARRLNVGGAMSLHLAAPWAQRRAALASIVELRDAFAVVAPFPVSVPIYGGQWLMALCGRAPFVSLDAAATAERLQQLQGPPLRSLNAEILSSLVRLAPPYLLEDDDTGDGTRTQP